MMMTPQELVSGVDSLVLLPEKDRVTAFNMLQEALGRMVKDIAPDPAVSPRLVDASTMHGNDYNPNKVASVEMDLLENSMRADGITMSVVVMRDKDTHVVIDGFHRHKVSTERLGRKYIPCSVIDRPLVDRMASTVRHNRARGKHHVDLMANLVKGMMGLGWDDEKIAENLGMSVEELLRLRQMVGAARMMADAEYSREWGVIEAVPDEAGDDDPTS
jgi:ParB-like chromosome segregation protein Spo0J